MIFSLFKLNAPLLAKWLKYTIDRTTIIQTQSGSWTPESPKYMKNGWGSGQEIHASSTLHPSMFLFLTYIYFCMYVNGKCCICKHFLILPQLFSDSYTDILYQEISTWPLWLSQYIQLWVNTQYGKHYVMYWLVTIKWLH